MARLNPRSEIIILSDQQLAAMVDYACRQEDVLALILYGSYGTARQTPLSDVDLAVLTMPGVKWEPHRELAVATALASIGRQDDINMVNLRTVPVTLQMNVLEEGRILFCRSEVQLADFVECVIRGYCDFEPDLRSINSDFDAGLREEFL